jgi:hypothetical protein
MDVGEAAEIKDVCAGSVSMKTENEAGVRGSEPGRPRTYRKTDTKCKGWIFVHV